MTYITIRQCFIVGTIATLGLLGCKDDDTVVSPEPTILNTIPAFYLPSEEASYGMNEPIIELIAGSTERVDEPWDLDFHPFRENELWILNKGFENTGGSTVTLSNAGMSNQSYEWRRDGNAWHFMAHPTALSFSLDNGNWATTPEILDANRRGGAFTGPSLWSSDMSIYARPSGGNGSHLDMLHESPYSMGIEWDKGNAFWVYDGHNEDICWYDFAEDHGPGASNHDDGRVHRYTDMVTKRKPGVASHLVLDRESGWLYLADAGNARILKMNTKTGSKKRNITQAMERLAENIEITGVDWKVFASSNLQEPSGIDIDGDILYVSDHKTGEIIAYSLKLGYEIARFDTGKKGIMGIKVDKNGHLWFVSTDTDEVYRIIPQ